MTTLRVGTISRKDWDRMDGQYIAGFVDGEGSFHVAFQERKDLRFGWQAVPEFHVSQNFPSRKVLEGIRDTLQCGYIKANDAAGKADKTLVYVVRDRKDLLQKIIPFFERYPLLSEKRNDFELFRKIVRRIEAGEHLKLEGFEQIVCLAYAMNAKGRYRKRKMEVILAKLEILRDCTLEPPQIVAEKIQSDLRGDTKTQAEMSERPPRKGGLVAAQTER